MNNVLDFNIQGWGMCMGVAFLGNNKSNEPQNVNKWDHVQKTAGFPVYEPSSSVNSGDTNKFYELQQNFPRWTNEWLFTAVPRVWCNEVTYHFFCNLEKNSVLYLGPSRDGGTTTAVTTSLLNVSILLECFCHSGSGFSSTVKHMSGKIRPHPSPDIIAYHNHQNHSLRASMTSDVNTPRMWYIYCVSNEPPQWP